ncbi:MAG: N-(5'-phosphoribosyl)anthranilate isomerase [Phaeodactylibacter sp.]|nr:N-(5'-phosphoribosyl)anthranilate isomerase [Phaeodactylibacter sp.]MCB9275101.1 N-(5'-phosphoribosyl)anthranilate isomerase [Lewinellaceae bacterium]
MLKTNVKASSVTNLTDARYFAAWEVAWLGFNFDAGSDRYIQPQLMKAIREWVDGVKAVGEFNMQAPEEIRAAAELLALDAVQVGMFTDLSALDSLGLGVPVIQELVLESVAGLDAAAEQMARGKASVDIFLLNFDKNGMRWSELLPAERERLRLLCREYHILLSIGLAPGEAASLLEEVAPYGISLQGGDEEKVGFKSFDELDDLFEAIEAEE